MAAEAARVLDEWRHAERLLRLLPDDAPERSEVELHVDQLRALFHHLTDVVSPMTGERLATSRSQIERIHALLDHVATRYRAPGP